MARGSPAGEMRGKRPRATLLDRMGWLMLVLLTCCGTATMLIPEMRQAVLHMFTFLQDHSCVFVVAGAVGRVNPALT